MAFTIKDLFQIQGALYTLILIGFILAKIKLFMAAEIWPLYEVVRLSCFSGMIFNLIGNTKLTMYNWKPFFPIAIAQLVIHILVVIATFAVKSDNRLITYIRFVTSFSFQECTIFIYQILDVIFPGKYNVMAIMYLLCEEFIYMPILKILMFILIGGPEDESTTEEPKAEEEEDSLQEADGIEGFEEDNMDRNDVEDVEENKDETKDEKKDDTKPLEPEVKPPTLKSTIITAWVNPNTICAILGFIWAATGITMPALMKNFVTDLTKCVSGSMIFGIGAIVGNINLWRWHLFIPITLVVNYILFPLLVGGFCRAFKIPHEQSKAAVLLACSPTSLIALHRMPDSDQMIGPHIAFMWSALLWLPFAFGWGAILLYTNIF